MAEIIVVQGYPGAGKSTQANRLVHDPTFDLEVLHISAGKRLRDIRTGNTHSRHAAIINAPDAPSPLPNEIVNDVVFEPAEQASDSALLLIDGYPRHPSAIDVFADYIQEHRYRYLGAVALEITLDTSLNRITNRGDRPGEKMRGRNFTELGQKRFNDHKRLTLTALRLLEVIAPVERIDANDNEDIVWSRFRAAIDRLISYK